MASLESKRLRYDSFSAANEYLIELLHHGFDESYQKLTQMHKASDLRYGKWGTAESCR
jgi:hypothetical protein